MKSLQILGLLVAAGAVGAVAGGLVGAFSDRPAPAGNDLLLERLDELARNVDALRDAAGASRDDVADLRERLVAVELELADRPATSIPIAGAPDALPGAAAPDLTAEELTADLERRRHDMELRARDMELAAGRAAEMKDRMLKGLRIRALPEEERWQLAADTLGLNSVQVDEIKAAHAELQEALKEAVVEETTEADGGALRFRRVDGNKMREAREAFQARVDHALNDEQKEAWRDEGFDAAFARRSGLPTFRVRGISAEPVDLSAGATAPAIEIVTTEVRTKDGKDD